MEGSAIIVNADKNDGVPRARNQTVESISESPQQHNVNLQHAVFEPQPDFGQDRGVSGADHRTACTTRLALFKAFLDSKHSASIKTSSSRRHRHDRITTPNRHKLNNYSSGSGSSSNDSNDSNLSLDNKPTPKIMSMLINITS
ncbi:hypothetical protein CkaCkLH20_13090 [Colletotrichum karsti]|uniref:Uncharacterized protein n=1 Tax=Colletotrichum karsti TaxID=1095194 RepID=A0A9P6LDQ6_9PEZI|nr:uncharacterized protein CkaCkLH20_13090 [Colletotrichum karsti]KAF9869428.1 hypothetical protein CkaCkLH20_13090 [Colletotrichum karsti]